MTKLLINSDGIHKYGKVIFEGFCSVVEQNHKKTLVWYIIKPKNFQYLWTSIEDKYVIILPKDYYNISIGEISSNIYENIEENRQKIEENR